MKAIGYTALNFTLIAAFAALSGCTIFNCGGPNGCFGAPWHRPNEEWWNSMTSGQYLAIWAAYALPALIVLARYAFETPSQRMASVLVGAVAMFLTAGPWALDWATYKSGPGYTAGALWAVIAFAVLVILRGHPFLRLRSDLTAQEVRVPTFAALGVMIASTAVMSAAMASVLPLMIHAAG